MKPYQPINMKNFKNKKTCVQVAQIVAIHKEISATDVNK
jgi:hypothetical protein